MFRVRVRIDRRSAARRAAMPCSSGLARRRLFAHRPSRAMAGSAAGERRRQRDERAVVPVARLERVTQRYGRQSRWTTSRSHFRPAAMVGLIGPDGVGKSTLLSILAGARQIQSGSVSVLDGDMTNAAHRAAVCSAHRLHAAGPGQEPLSGPQRPREHRVLWPPVRAARCRARSADCRTCSTAPALRRLPIGRRRSSPAACGRSSACAAR